MNRYTKLVKTYQTEYLALIFYHHTLHILRKSALDLTTNHH